MAEALVCDIITRLVHLHGRTVIEVTHRLHTCATADKIVVIKQGLVAEMGTHAELVARGGASVYQQMLQAQNPAEPSRGRFRLPLQRRAYTHSSAASESQPASRTSSVSAIASRHAHPLMSISKSAKIAAIAHFSNPARQMRTKL
eukprot:tig00000133_g7709.t1